MNQRDVLLAIRRLTTEVDSQNQALTKVMDLALDRKSRGRILLPEEILLTLRGTDILDGNPEKTQTIQTTETTK